MLPSSNYSNSDPKSDYKIVIFNVISGISKQIFFGPFGPHLVYKLGGKSPPLDPPLKKRKTFACLETKHYIPAVKIIELFLRFCCWLLSIFHWFWKFMNMSAGDLCLILFMTPNKQFYVFFLKAFFLFFLTQGT